MSEKLTVIIQAIRKEEIRREEESFEEFIQRLRRRYTRALKTERVHITVVERRDESTISE